jgi:hypothetical protein
MTAILSQWADRCVDPLRICPSFAKSGTGFPSVAQPKAMFQLRRMDTNPLSESCKKRLGKAHFQ